jgi:antitoxin VapB
MPASRRVKLFRNGRNQAVRIPVDFELPGGEALMRREGRFLVLEPIGKPSLLQILATLEPIDEDFPDVDEGLLPPRNVEL